MIVTARKNADLDSDAMGDKKKKKRGIDGKNKAFQSSCISKG